MRRYRRDYAESSFDVPAPASTNSRVVGKDFLQRLKRDEGWIDKNTISDFLDLVSTHGFNFKRWQGGFTEEYSVMAKRFISICHYYGADPIEVAGTI